MLIKTPHFKVGDKVAGKNLGKMKNEAKRYFKGKIVYIFKRFEIPSKKKIIKYYGIDIINPKHGKVFGPMFEDRVVVKKFGKGKNYLVFPMAGYERYFTIHKIED